MPSKKILIIISSILLVLLIVRLSLPYFLIHYVENRINRIPEFRVKIKDLDVHLIRGSYVIKELALHKITNDVPVPFFNAERINLSVQWSALIHGALVAKIEAHKPMLHFVIEPSKKNEQLSIDKEWERAVKALFPLNFNKIILQDGTISLQSFKGKPPFKLALEHINFQIENLQKIKDTNGLFSTFSGKGVINKGNFTIEGSVDPFAKSPTFLLKSSLKSMNIVGANDFLLHFTHIDVQQGEFSLYSEIAAGNNKISGYAKPLIKNLKILDLKSHPNPIEFLYKGVLEIGSKILTNQKTKNIATKIKIQGSIEDPDTSIFSIIGYILRNAFIQALLPQIDHTVELRDVLIDKNSFK